MPIFIPKALTSLDRAMTKALLFERTSTGFVAKSGLNMRSQLALKLLTSTSASVWCLPMMIIYHTVDREQRRLPPKIVSSSSGFNSMGEYAEFIDVLISLFIKHAYEMAILRLVLRLPYNYLSELFENLPSANTQEALAKLLPY